VIPSEKGSGMAVWRKSLFAMMHLNANLPAVAYFGVPAAQVVEIGLEVDSRASHPQCRTTFGSCGHSDRALQGSEPSGLVLRIPRLWLKPA
jgi:potassium transporter